MANRFAVQFARSAAPNLLKAFGESVVYYPRGSSVGRTIKAIVDRSEAPQFVVRVKNDPGDGISSQELDTGGDEISFSLREGEDSVRRSVVSLLDDSSGMTRVVCE